MEQLAQIVVTNIHHPRTVSLEKGIHNEIRQRQFYGLSFCIKGQITYTHCGKEIISDQNHAILLPKGQCYTLHCDKKGLFPLIDFDCLDTLCDTVIAIPIRNTEAFIKDFEQIKSLSLLETNRARIFGIFYQLIHRLSVDETQTSHLLQPAIHFMEQMYFSPEISNTILAQQCRLSEVYFRRLFTQTYGITPWQHILELRIGKAKQLLTDGILTINAISDACGFTSVYHFSRLFKQKTGLTPSAYMQIHKSSHL